MSNRLPMEGAKLQPELDYEPPQVESVLTAEKLEREVLYAGSISHHGGERDANPDTIGFRPY
jgi:hypothetical protein